MYFQPLSASRLDQAIAAAFPELSRKMARRLVESHSAIVNGRVVSVASRTVRPQDHVHVVTELVELPILQITPEYLAVDKPTGIASQPSRDRSRLSVPDILGLQLKRHGMKSDLFVVHRLDVETSGVLLFGRTREGAALISGLLSDREVSKFYLAVVRGRVEKELIIESRVARVSGSHFGTGLEGKEALSKVSPKLVRNDYTLVEVQIHTGRTHQIRVHLQSIGHPVVGDRKYASSAESQRLLLHHARLQHPALALIESPIPAAFREQMKALGLD